MERISAEIAGSLARAAGARATILLQAANPIVKEGAKDHSSFRESLFHAAVRLIATGDYDAITHVGSEEDKEWWFKQLDKMHSKVKGEIKDGELPEGTRYRAADPQAALWVQASLLYMALKSHETFVGEISYDDKNKYLLEMAPVSRRLHIPGELIITDYAALLLYIENTLASGQIKVTRDSLEVLDLILYPLPLVPRFAYDVFCINAITSGLLPYKLRKAYGLQFGLRERLAFDAFAFVSRIANTSLPCALTKNLYHYDWFLKLRRMAIEIVAGGI